jgi:hypothetical protein
MRVFAQISGGICVAITQAQVAPLPVAGDLFVEIASYDPSYLGRTYAGGKWV